MAHDFNKFLGKCAPTLGLVPCEDSEKTLSQILIDVPILYRPRADSLVVFGQSADVAFHVGLRQTRRVAVVRPARVSLCQMGDVRLMSHEF
jgi:hypothetical protein